MSTEQALTDIRNTTASMYHGKGTLIERIDTAIRAEKVAEQAGIPKPLVMKAMDDGKEEYVEFARRTLGISIRA